MSGNCKKNDELTIVVEVTDYLGSSSRCGTASNYPCATAMVAPYNGNISTFMAGLREQAKAVALGISSSADLAKIVLAIQTARTHVCLNCGPHGQLSLDGRACICDIDHSGPECKAKETFAWDEWSEWSECDSGCDGGKSQRRRECFALSHSTTVTSSKCRGDGVDVKVCNTQSCASEWSDWGDCSVFCEKDTPGVFWGKRQRQRTCFAHSGADSSECEFTTEEHKSCSKACKASCPDHCSGHGACVSQPADCVDPSACSMVCDCEESFAGPTCAVGENQRQTEHAENAVLMNAIWTSVEGTLLTCTVLRNALSMVMEIVRGDLGALSVDDQTEMFERILSTFLSSPQCLGLINNDLTEILGLVPPYIKSERLRLRTPHAIASTTTPLSKVSRKVSRGKRPRGKSPDQRRLQQSVEAKKTRLTKLSNFLRNSMQKLTEDRLALSVPGEKPVQISSGEVLRLTSTNNVGTPTSVCTSDESSCAAYPPNSLQCPGNQNHFGIAVVGAIHIISFWQAFSVHFTHAR